MWLKGFEEKEGRPAGNEEKVRPRGAGNSPSHRWHDTYFVPASLQQLVVMPWILSAF